MAWLTSATSALVLGGCHLCSRCISCSLGCMQGLRPAMLQATPGGHQLVTPAAPQQPLARLQRTQNLGNTRAPQHLCASRWGWCAAADGARWCSGRWLSALQQGGRHPAAGALSRSQSHCVAAAQGLSGMQAVLSCHTLRQ